MRQLIRFFEHVIAQGMKHGEFPKGNSGALATMIVASLEGGIMLSSLYRDRRYMMAVLPHLNETCIWHPATAVRVPNAGHIVHFDQPGIVRSIAENA
jgi:hypothetical protein